MFAYIANIASHLSCILHVAIADKHAGFSLHLYPINPWPFVVSCCGRFSM